MRRRRRALAIGLSAVSIATGCVLGLSVYLLRDIPTLRLSDFVDLSAASLVYANDGTLIGRFAGNGDRRPLQTLQEAGRNIQLAFIAAEDKDFYRHVGIDPVAIVRSAIDDIRHHAIRSGGSTITQQTVKLAMFPRQERTLRRKLQEMALALELEHRQTKTQILSEYLNAIYFGRMNGVPVYGIESAALHVFGRRAKDVTVAQAALLAAIPNNPSFFSLRRHPDRVRNRQIRILSKMRELKFLSAREYAAALGAPVLSEVRHDATLLAPYESKMPFILAQVSRLAPQMISESERIPLEQARDQLESGGYRIYTSIDQQLQSRVANILHNSGFPPPVTYTVHDRFSAHVVHNAEEEVGLVLLQNRSARILALAGGRSYATNQVDHAVARRQAGSSLKPLVVYGPALEQGIITPGSIVDDIPREYPDPYAANGEWTPLNWDQKYHGLMTVRDALMQSYNLPAIELLNQMGPQTGARFAWQLGLTGIEREDANSLGLAIGGTHGGVSPLELASAYASLPAGGVYTESSLIDRIDDAFGNPIYKRHARPRRVFSNNTAALLTTMLEQVIKSPYGTAHSLHALLSHGDVAGKTGTTDNNRDAWFVGYTPQYTMSAWVGYDIPHALLTTPRYHESTRATKLFGQILAPLIALRHDRFTLPSGIMPYLICTKSGLLASPLCKAVHETETDYFCATSAPAEVCRDHQLVLTVKIAGKRYLATELTPPEDIRTEILFNRPAVTIDQKHKNDAPTDLFESIPTQSDPRGGAPLVDVQRSSTTVTPPPPSP